MGGLTDFELYPHLADSRPAGSESELPHARYLYQRATECKQTSLIAMARAGLHFSGMFLIVVVIAVVVAVDWQVCFTWLSIQGRPD